MARRQLRQFSRQSRPNRGWAGSVAAAQTTVPAASKVLISTFSLDNDGIDETILRTVGMFQITSDQVAANELQLGAVGMCIVTDTAIATGITAIPDPVTDAGDDVWLLYKSFTQEFLQLDATGVYPQFATQYEFDQKAKRIVHSGMAGAIVVANAHATHGFQIALNLRVLSQVRGTR